MPPTPSPPRTRRQRSNTPLQALTLLNDEAFHEFAVAFAQRIARSDLASDSLRIQQGFRIATGRSPDPAETDALLQLLATERQQGILADAAWVSVARVLLNLDETITRE